MPICPANMRVQSSSRINQTHALQHCPAFPKSSHISCARHRRRIFHSHSIRAHSSPNEQPTVVTDDAVPEAHRGLHNFLYDEGGAEAAHGTAAASLSAAYTFREGEDDGSSIVPLDSYLQARDNERPVGVFALYDDKKNLQYVSFSRNVVLSTKTIRSRVGEDRTAYVRVMVFANKAMQTRAALQREAENWLEEAGTMPPGNGAEKDLWEGTAENKNGGVEASFDVSTMSDAERAEYEDKKEKLRRAMGEKLNNGYEASAHEPTIAERQANLKAAVEQGDWSQVIDQQTAQTIDEDTKPTIVTPFARASVHRSIGNNPEAAHGTNNGSQTPALLPMTVENVDRTLDDVRPYLIADGGNVDVVSVENGIVALQLQGACGTCPSSTATMKMGIERSLRAAFGDQLKEVISIGGHVDTAASVEAIDMHLNILRGAVAAYGGSIEVLSMDNSKRIAFLKYTGPKPIGYGIVAAVKDKFPDVVEVVMIDGESGNVIEF